MSSKISLAQSFEDVNLPGDDAYSDPRWHQVEIAPGIKLWDWQPDYPVTHTAPRASGFAPIAAVWLPRLAAMAVSFVVTLLPLLILS